MKIIVAVVQPFQTNQYVYVFDNNDTIVDKAETTMMNFVGVFNNLVGKHEDIKDIELVGPKAFCQHIVEDYNSVNNKFSKKVPIMIAGGKK